MAPITFAVLTVSDSCYAQGKKDISGPKLLECVLAAFPDTVHHLTALLPDKASRIASYLKSMVDQGINVVLTTGGTGFSPRDVTPKATRSVIEREAPGLMHAMMSGSLRVTPMAMLSNAVCGISHRTIIINLPGSAKAAVECFGFVKDVLPHAVALVTNNLEDVRMVHDDMQKSSVKLSSSAARKRSSPYPMVEVSEAMKMVEAAMGGGAGVEEVDIGDALYRVALEDVYSKEPLPPFPASTKDGYAAVASDISSIRMVRQALAAGDEPSTCTLLTGEVARINTGALLPPGADAVIQVEDTEVSEATESGEEVTIKILILPKLGQDIRPIGCDIPANTKLFSKGEAISPGHIGVMAAVGTTKIKVARKLTVGVISTGNEVQDPRESPKPGHVRDSNKLALIALLKQQHYIATDCGIAKDNPDDVKAKLASALARHDVVVTTGGVSMGEFDVVKEVLIQDFGATVHFGRVNMKPGKPTTFATCKYLGKSKFVFGLPGNPVSAMVTASLFVIPGIRMAEGFPQPPELIVRLGEAIRLDPRPEYMRARVTQEDGLLVGHTTGDQISSRMVSFLGAQVLLILPMKKDGLEVLAAGASVKAIKIDHITL